LEECTPSIFIVTKVVQVDAKPFQAHEDTGRNVRIYDHYLNVDLADLKVIFLQDLASVEENQTREGFL
jgi:hypothetical protein